MFYIAICDDEEYFRIREQQLILKYMEKKAYNCKIDLFDSGKEILKLKDSILQYDMIFLDINMKEIDGIETAKKIRKVTQDVYIVFVTAFITYALEGYKVDAVRYLLKDDDCLEKAINECLETILQKMDYEEHKMTFEFQEGKRDICLDDIIYIESNLHKLIFHMAGKSSAKYTMYARLDEINELLQGTGFCRIHKSYLVNFKYVESVERYKAELTDGQSLGISKARCRYCIITCMITLDYFISVTLDGNIILKEIVIIGLGTFFMWLYFRQKCVKIAILVLLYQGICVMMDYISILAMSKCFPAITIERLSEPLVNSMLGVLSQMLLICFIMVSRRYVVKKSTEKCKPLI